MKKIPGCRWVALLAFVLGATSARAQDAAVVAKNHYRVLVDNAFVRVVENTLKPGEKDPMHTHPAGWFYVTQPGTMKVVHENGRVEMWEAKAGKQGWSDAEGPHTSENVGKTTMGFVLVEVKSAASLPPRR
jgi:oxalate decarboxylase/phosphoglucose isomerase-like protein (cupin superfamily)